MKVQKASNRYFLEKKHDDCVVCLEIDPFQYCDIDADALGELKKMENPVMYVYLHLDNDYREIVGVGTIYCEQDENESNIPEEGDDLSGAIEKLAEMGEIELAG